MGAFTLASIGLLGSLVIIAALALVSIGAICVGWL
jgi:hypothetical protein